MTIRALNVAEKPSVAKEISAILSSGNPSRRNGFSPYNGIFEFGYQIQGQQVDMVVTSVSGHLMEIDFPETFRNWSSTDPSSLFTAPIEKRVPQDKEPIQKTLLAEARTAQWLILWLDCDREGENIAFEVIEVCKRANSRLKILRARFSALVPRDIHAACQRLCTPNELDSIAVDARQEIDLRIGAAFTRFQTLRIRNKYDGVPDSVVSYGPCQFPTLGFVVERYLARENFIPEPFWSIKSTVKRNETEATFNWKRGQVYDHFTCLVFYEFCVLQPTATITSVVGKPTKKFKPLPLTTVELQRRCARFLKFSSEHCMKVAEDLYQKGYLSYPRTETDRFSPNMDLRSFVQNQVNSPQWGAYAANLLAGKFREPRQGKNDDNSHPPIHPTKYIGDLSGDSKALYELVVRHYLACCSDDAQGFETVVEMKISQETFRATGLVIKERNFLDVYPYEKWVGNNIPDFTIGEQFIPTTLVMTEGTTTAPQLLTESDLLSLMDKNGIGTDATMAQHISNIQERGYAEKRNNFFVPTTFGLALYRAYEQMNLDMTKPDLRRKMEDDMKRISQGSKRKQDVVLEWVQTMSGIFAKVKSEAIKIDQSIASHFSQKGLTSIVLALDFATCGVCRGMMDLRGSGEDRMLGCEACQKVYALPRKGDLSTIDFKCPVCNFQVLLVKNERGEHNLCPKCFSDPPPDQQIENTAAPNFRCFNCSVACQLARKADETPICNCPACRKSSLVLKKTKESSYMLVCKDGITCTYRFWLPRVVMEASVSSTTCHTCPPAPIRHIKVALKTSQIPMHLPSNYEGCIAGCDPMMKEIFQEMGNGLPPFVGQAVKNACPPPRQATPISVQSGFRTPSAYPSTDAYRRQTPQSSTTYPSAASRNTPTRTAPTPTTTPATRVNQRSSEKTSTPRARAPKRRAEADPNKPSRRGRRSSNGSSQ